MGQGTSPLRVHRAEPYALGELSSINICSFQGSFEPIFLTLFFIHHLTLSSLQFRRLLIKLNASFSVFIVNSLYAKGKYLKIIHSYTFYEYLRQPAFSSQRSSHPFSRKYHAKNGTRACLSPQYRFRYFCITASHTLQFPAAAWNHTLPPLLPRSFPGRPAGSNPAPYPIR